jgi:hypothetical protein
MTATHSLREWAEHRAGALAIIGPVVFWLFVGGMAYVIWSMT